MYYSSKHGQTDWHKLKKARIHESFHKLVQLLMQHALDSHDVLAIQAPVFGSGDRTLNWLLTGLSEQIKY